MFGMTMVVEHKDQKVTLRPFCKEDLVEVAKGFSSMEVHRYTMQTFSQTLENEQEWYDGMRKSKEDVAWAIVPQGSDVPVGITGLHRIDIFGSCTSGIVIWDKSWWGKGVASCSHLARTLFAADQLNRYTIQSGARVPNQGSFKALQAVGYHLVGVEPRTGYRDGSFMDSYRLVWLNPERISILFPEGLPRKFRQSVTKAQSTLNLAREVVRFE